MPTGLLALLPADAPPGNASTVNALILGEQHDNADHQQIQRVVVETLAARGQLAALAIEMAVADTSTAQLGPQASETEVKNALNWDEAAWPWKAYGPTVMAAVQRGVPVVGANLPRAAMREAMANTALDTRLDAAALQRQNQNIREGHCDLLPASQIVPMTRVQIARDVAMAQTIMRMVARTIAQNAGHALFNTNTSATRSSAAGKTVLLIAGSGHADNTLGVARHLGAGATVKSVLLAAQDSEVDANTVAAYDAVWPSLPGPKKDYCADLKGRLAK